MSQQWYKASRPLKVTEQRYRKVEILSVMASTPDMVLRSIWWRSSLPLLLAPGLEFCGGKAEVRFRVRRVPGNWREEARRADRLWTLGEIRNL